MKIVEMILSEQVAQEKDKKACMRAICRAFNVGETKAFRMMDYNGTVIRCRQDQFADFIIYRIEEGVTNNRIACLKAKYIECGQTDYYDVTRN